MNVREFVETLRVKYRSAGVGERELDTAILADLQCRLMLSTIEHGAITIGYGATEVTLEDDEPHRFAPRTHLVAVADGPAERE